MTITPHDLTQLIREPSPRVRSHIAAKVSESFNRSHFTSNENKLAIEIFRLLMRDTSASVRRAIAENLKHSTQVPRDILVSLINDDADIAVPIIECSDILTDDDIAELLDSGREVRKWLAVTRRSRLSARISRKLIGTHHGDVVLSLLGNDGAVIDEAGFEAILRGFGSQQNILEALVCRGDLSPRLAEKLHALASTQLKKQLTRRYRLPFAFIGAQIDAVRESAMLRFFSERMDDAELAGLVRQMYKNRRLSDTLIIRAMLAGEIRFVETALSVRACIPQVNAHTLLSDRGTLGFRTLYLAAAMPQDFLEPLDLVLRFLQKEYTVMRGSGETSVRLLDYLVTNGYDRSVANMQALIELIRHPLHDPRTLH